MRLLTENNTIISVDSIPETETDIRYCILDYQKEEDADYFFVPMFSLETITAPAVDLIIGGMTVTMPLDWSIVVGDKHTGEPELVPLAMLNSRNFDAFCFNPLTGFRPEFMPVNIIDYHEEINWVFPPIKPGCMLVTPLSPKPVYSTKVDWKTKQPYQVNTVPCALFAKDQSGIPECLNISYMC